MTKIKRVGEWKEGALGHATASLEHLLDSFRRSYSGKLHVQPLPIDLTDCFTNKEGKQRKPRSFGGFEAVFGYVVSGAPFIKKYEMKIDPAGKAHLFQGKEKRPAVVAPGRDFKVMSLLSTLNMHNTSLYEVLLPFVKAYSAETGEFSLRKDEEVQGFRRWNILALIEKVRRFYPEFHPLRDSLFMTAGTPGVVRAKISLNCLLFQQFLDMGKGAPFEMSEGEAGLLEDVVGQANLLYVLDDFRIGYYPMRIGMLNYHSSFYAENKSYESIAFAAHKLKGYAAMRGVYIAIFDQIRKEHVRLPLEKVGYISSPNKEISGQTVAPRVKLKSPYEIQMQMHK